MHLSGLLSYTVPLAAILSAIFAYTQITKEETKHNFIFKEKRTYPEYNIEAYLYVHSIHGSPFVHIKTNDTHNFFATTFRTTCIDDTGATHVLEHMSLHGSENYPINSVFSELLKRSLATLLNAFTSIEWTAYPFSTTNFNDFFNILNVYLDASFHPQLNQVAFESECHHLEFESPNDTSTPLHHSGVVYNEMVGSMSKPTAYFESLIRKNLYPDSLFRLEYGGYPPSVAKLTLNQLKKMHDMYYHPSNALFFHYGSFDVDKIMEKINQVISDPQFSNVQNHIYNFNDQNKNTNNEKENDQNNDDIYQQIDEDPNNDINDGNYHPDNEINDNQAKLQQNNEKNQDNKDEKSIHQNLNIQMKNKNGGAFIDLENLINQPRWNKPRFVVAEGPSNGQKGENGEEKVTVSVSWMVGDLRNITEITDLSFLSLLLTDTILSPLYKSLINTRIGTKFINTGFLAYTRSPYFSIGLEGVDMKEAVKFNQTVLDILNDVYKNGFDQDRIYSTLHNFEISQKTISDSQGINFWEQLISFWIHGVDPFEVLDENWQIERIKRVLKINPRYFEIILKNQLINNNHRLDLIMKGVQNFQEKQAEKVKEELAEMKQNMSQQELDQIVEETNKIRQFVDAPRPVHLLPSITKKDINETQPTKVAVEYPLNNDRIMTFVQPTNDIVYLTVKCDLPVESKDIELVPLLSLILSKIGAGDLDEDEFTNQVSLYTGGISVSYSIVPSKDNPNEFKACLLFSGSALSEDAEKFVKLIDKMIKQPRLNNTKRISIILSEAVSAMPNRIADSGHSYAQIYSSAGLSTSATLQEMWSGITNMRLMRKILSESQAEQQDKTKETLTDKLTNAYFKNLVLSSESSFTASITCCNGDKDRMNSLVKDLLSSLPYSQTPPVYSENRKNTIIEEAKSNFLLHPRVHLKIDSSTFFCGISVPSPSYETPSSPSFQVAARLIQSEYLFAAIREKLGAYSTMARYSALTGTISFLSYRDTSPVLVLSTINEIVEAIANPESKQANSLPHVDDEMVDRAIVQVFSSFDSPVAPKDAGNSMFLLGINDEILQKRRTALLKVTKKEVVDDFAFISRKKKEKMAREVIVGGKIDSTHIPDFYVVDVFDLDKK